MASPLSKNLMAGAIGESGAAIASLPPRPLAEAEQNGAKFAAAAGADSLAALRAMTAEQLQDAAAKAQGIRFSTAMDGYFLPKTLTEIFEAGEQAKSPAAGRVELPRSRARGRCWRAASRRRKRWPRRSRSSTATRPSHVLKAYAADDDRTRCSRPPRIWPAPASSRYGTWKWTELHMKTGGKPVYRYLYATRASRRTSGCRASRRRRRRAWTGRGVTAAAPRGAAHSAEIQYAMGNLDLDKRYAWEPADYEVSKTMQAYFVNFIKTGNPERPGPAGLAGLQSRRRTTSACASM